MSIPSGPDEAEGDWRGDSPSFLVELRSQGGARHEVQRMLRALRLAVSRQASAGAGISWASALVVPSDCSCLCVLEAAEIAEINRALDVAGLRVVAVRRAYPLADPLAGGAYDERAIARHLSPDVPHSPKELS